MLSTANVSLISDQSDRMLDWIREHKEEISALGALGPIPWLLDQVKPSPLADSLSQMSTLFFTVARMMVMCHVYFDTAPEMKPGTQGPGVPRGEKGRTDGTLGRQECMRLQQVFDMLFRTCSDHFPDRSW